MSTAETKIDSFAQAPNTVDAIFIDPEQAQIAAEIFQYLCEDELLRHAQYVQFDRAHHSATLYKAAVYGDRSLIKAEIDSTEVRDQAVSVNNDPHEAIHTLIIESRTPVPDSMVSGQRIFDSWDELRSVYQLAQDGDTVRKTIHRPMDDMRRARHRIEAARANAPEGEWQAAADDAFAVDLDAMREQHDACIDGSVLVGPDEVNDLRFLIADLRVLSGKPERAQK